MLYVLYLSYFVIFRSSMWRCGGGAHALYLAICHPVLALLALLIVIYHHSTWGLGRGPFLYYQCILYTHAHIHAHILHVYLRTHTHACTRMCACVHAYARLGRHSICAYATRAYVRVCTRIRVCVCVNAYARLRMRQACVCAHVDTHTRSRRQHTLAHTRA